MVEEVFCDADEVVPLPLAAFTSPRYRAPSPLREGWTI